MKHIENIERLLEKGHTEDAWEALDNLLTLGPNNVAALKLKAFLYKGQGRFAEEEGLWHKIYDIDNEDLEALEFIQKRQLEDREHYYFTDDLPDGGRRFLAYPRSLVKISIIGLMGCLAFLMLTRVIEQNQWTNGPIIILISFFFLVISPWVAIIWTWSHSIRSVEINKSGIEVTTRFKSFPFKWNELDRICLAYSPDPNEPDLRLVLLPKSPYTRPIEIDMNEESSAIRARIHLITEISTSYYPIGYEDHSKLELENKSTLTF
ncbi:MAG: hypothetical protein CMP10_09110 [Zetaproteobacteria bacterium]|nr:hypothetical protein [Pseudobdellovibrionaceae bacterium]